MTKKWLLVLIVLGILAVLGFVSFTMSYKGPIKDMSAGVGNIQFEVVTTEAAQEKGLGGRAEVPTDYGMLFVLPSPERIGIWMKDMLVPIDIIWLTDNGTVTLIDSDVSPATYPHVFQPPMPVKYVLETKAGYAEEKQWTIGSKIPLPAPYGTPGH